MSGLKTSKLLQEIYNRRFDKRELVQSKHKANPDQVELLLQFKTIDIRKMGIAPIGRVQGYKFGGTDGEFAN